jgi:hypothetical protein
MNEIALIGTSHTYQRPGNPDAGTFEGFIKSLLDSSNFAAIVEEMSAQALSEQGAALSICKRVADEQGVRHLYCDPDRQTRSRHEIRQENEIRATAHFKRISEQEILKQIQASYDRREQYWLDRILELDCWPVLFVCGANHVDSFGAKVKAGGLSAKVLISDWSPSPNGS